jgi:hypothetical protein
MTEEESLEAAKLFSIIATRAKDNQKYKEISLDFLNLLNLRNKLNKISLKKMHEFEAIHQDSSWTMLFEAE